MTHEPTTLEAGSLSLPQEDVACAIVVAGPVRGVFDLPRGADVAIGRSRSSAIPIEDPGVSRLHATLRWDGGATVMLTDHGSRNGTLVDGRRVEGAIELRGGAEIVLGPARVVVVVPRTTGERLAPGSADPAMRRVATLAERAAACDLPVLLVGETGVGKEVLAKRIHERSARGAEGAFVAVNCGSIPESLAEATLFGHEKGAFTGAHARREGVFEAANRGTLFLDEVGELAPTTQVRLLRALEEGVITRVGATAPVKIDVRVITATHRDLDAMAKQGTFRKDLLFRLDVLRIAIPPLRERPDDVIALAQTFLEELAPGVRLSPDAIALLRGHAWPGNVRELRNAMARAVALRESDVLGEADFAALLERDRPGGGILRGRMEDAERDAIVEALEACGGNQTRAAARLGISRRALIYKLERHGLKPPPRAS